MERLKDHNTSPPRPSESSRSGAKSCHSRLSHRSTTTTSSRKQFSDDSSPERRPSRTRSLDDYHSRHYGNRVFLQRLVLQHHGSKTVPDHMIFQDPHEGEKEMLGPEWNAKRASLVE